MSPTFFVGRIYNITIKHLCQHLFYTFFKTLRLIIDIGDYIFVCPYIYCFLIFEIIFLQSNYDLIHFFRNVFSTYSSISMEELRDD